jgi:RNA polymerase sigma-70 factor (ECF subfamily)
MTTTSAVETFVNDDDVYILASQKDASAFAPLYSKYHARLCRFAYQRLQSKDEAYEIVAISFCKALANIKNYTLNGTPFSSWLYRIVLNELNQQHRQNKIKRVINCENLNLNAIADELPDETKIENLYKLKHALQHLQIDELDIVEMRFFEKKSFSEIAEILELNEAAIKMRLYRTLEKLKKIITS